MSRYYKAVAHWKDLDVHRISGSDVSGSSDALHFQMSTASVNLQTCLFGRRVSLLNCCFVTIKCPPLSSRDPFLRAIANGRTVSIHPSSVLFGQAPECVVYNELVRTSRDYMRDLTRIDPAWLPELAPQVGSHISRGTLPPAPPRLRLCHSARVFGMSIGVATAFGL